MTHGASVAGDDLVDGYRVAALHHSSGDSGCVDRRVDGAHEEAAYKEPNLAGSCDEVDFVGHREDRLEGETLSCGQ